MCGYVRLCAVMIDLRTMNTDPRQVFFHHRTFLWKRDCYGIAFSRHS